MKDTCIKIVGIMDSRDAFELSSESGIVGVIPGVNPVTLPPPNVGVVGVVGALKMPVAGGVVGVAVPPAVL